MAKKQAQPIPPFPAQHQEKPGIESQLQPRPKYHAPLYKGSGKLQGKVALITGGDSGIGRAVAVLFAREGADVALVYLPEEQSDAEETRQAVEAEGHKALLLPGDVSRAAFCRKAVEGTVAAFGKLDILVNNAAFQQHQAGLEELSDQQWDHTFKTNIYGYFRMAKEALHYLKEGSAISTPGPSPGWKGASSCSITPPPRAPSTRSPRRWRRT
jgi:NAD(P)-dependent dehydrogenase (short-subunit alcohol dehydrogenase family)